MPIQIEDHGARNVVRIDPGVLAAGEGAITLYGDGNEVIIGAGSSTTGCYLRLGHRCRVEVGETVQMAKLEIYAAADGAVSIGDNTSFTHYTRLYLHEAGRISIGRRCLIADNTFATVSDMHSLVDIDTSERINRAADVDIGDDVWLAAEAVVLKGVRIGNGSAIGFRSVVTHDVPANCVVVGSPARIVRERATWKQELLETPS